MAEPQATATSAESDPANRQTLEQLTKRYQDLNARRIQANTNLENSERQLKQLQQEAREQYGTDDPKALQQLLEEMIAANERQRADYQAHLEALEQQLAAVEQAYQQNQQGGTAS